MKLHTPHTHAHPSMHVFTGSDVLRTWCFMVGVHMAEVYLDQGE